MGAVAPSGKGVAKPLYTHSETPRPAANGGPSRPVAAKTFPFGGREGCGGDGEGVPLPLKVRHSVENVDPDFVGTVAFRTAPGGKGQVYDWKAHHEANLLLSQQKKEKKQAQAVQDAAKKDLAYIYIAEKAFNGWLESKRLEKQLQTVVQASQLRRLTVDRTAGGMGANGFEPVTTSREKGWRDGFGSPAALSPPKAKKERSGPSEALLSGPTRFL